MFLISSLDAELSPISSLDAELSPISGRMILQYTFSSFLCSFHHGLQLWFPNAAVVMVSMYSSISVLNIPAETYGMMAGEAVGMIAAEAAGMIAAAEAAGMIAAAETVDMIAAEAGMIPAETGMIPAETDGTLSAEVDARFPPKVSMGHPLIICIDGTRIITTAILHNTLLPAWFWG